MISYIVLSIESQTQIINNMGFKAELVLDNKVYPLLLCDYEFSQTADHTGRPNPYITAGIIDIRVPMTRDDVLVDWVLQPSLMKKGTITIYKYDLSAVETTINFYNAHGLHYHLAFDANSAQAAYIDFRISAGELHLNTLIHENRWNPERHQAIVTPRETREEEPKKIITSFLEDTAGNRIQTPRKDQSVYLVVQTQEMIGHPITIDLQDTEVDFLYNNEVLPNDKLTDYTVTADTMRIPLKTIKQQ